MTLRTLTVAQIAAPDPRAIAIGPFGSNLTADAYVPSGVPVIRGQNIKDGGKLDETDMVFVSEETAARLPACIVSEGDLVFPHRGAIGRVGIVRDQRMLLSSSMMKLTVDKTKADPSFIFYYFRGPGRDELLMRASTVGTPGIGQPLSSLRGISIQIPSLPEQRAIAEVLGALDDKIAANTKLAETSSATSQALFQQLIAASSELTTLGQLLNLEYGKALPAAKRAHGHVAVYGSGGVVGAHNEALKEGPGIVVGRKGSAGMVYWSPGPFFPIDTTYYVDPKLGSETLPFCYHVLKSLRLAEMNSDSAVPGLNRAEALATKVQKVDYPAIAKFCAAAAPLFELAAEYEQENRTLAATRDALLPQLMSGKLRVSDIENIMGEMV